MSAEISARITQLSLQKDVILTGYVATEDLPWFYNAADVFAYLSLFEGFGLPVMEAMACGTPVITSAKSSLGEIASEAALAVDPTDGAAITTALERLLGDSALRDKLGHLGIRRSLEFQGERMALETVGVYKRVLGSEPYIASTSEIARAN